METSFKRINVWGLHDPQDKDITSYELVMQINGHEFVSEVLLSLNEIKQSFAIPDDVVEQLISLGEPNGNNSSFI